MLRALQRDVTHVPTATIFYNLNKLENDWDPREEKTHKEQRGSIQIGNKLYILLAKIYMFQDNYFRPVSSMIFLPRNLNLSI
jgi:hypothetical protein